MNGGIRNNIHRDRRVRGNDDMRHSKITTALAINAINAAKYTFTVLAMLLAVGNGWSAGQLAVALISIVGGAEIAKLLVKINYFNNKKENKVV